MFLTFQFNTLIHLIFNKWFEPQRSEDIFPLYSSVSWFPRHQMDGCLEDGHLNAVSYLIVESLYIQGVACEETMLRRLEAVLLPSFDICNGQHHFRGKWPWLLFREPLCYGTQTPTHNIAKMELGVSPRIWKAALGTFRFFGTEHVEAVKYCLLLTHSEDNGELCTPRLAASKVRHADI